MDLETLLQQGLAAAEAGRKQEARALLTKVVEQDDNQLEAWLWLSQVVDSLEEQVICLENVLTLEPDNQFAQQELAQVKARQATFFAPTYNPGDENPPLEAMSVPEAVKQPVMQEYPDRDEFDDEWLCPYCTSPTHPSDRICKACHQPLIIKKRIKDDRTVWLWRGILLQFVVIFFLMSLGTAYFALAVKLNGIPSPVPFLPLYFGQSVDQPPDLIQTVLTVFPRWAFWGIIGIVFYSFMLMVLLYGRVPYGHFIYLINSGMTLVLGLFGAIFYHNTTMLVVMWVVIVLLGLGQLLVTLNLWNDFTFKEGRLRLTIDRGVKNHQSLFISGRNYSRLGMWGLAVIHLRRAVSREPSIPAYHLALAVAYMKLKRYHLADEALSKAEKSGNTLEVLQLRRKLNSLLKSS